MTQPTTVGEGRTDRLARLPMYTEFPHNSPVWQELSDELERAMTRHASMHSPHEGWAVIKEELDELWEHVRANTGTTPEARHEAMQVAAMALRYIVDLTWKL